MCREVAWSGCCPSEGIARSVKVVVLVMLEMSEDSAESSSTEGRVVDEIPLRIFSSWAGATRRKMRRPDSAAAM